MKLQLLPHWCQNHKRKETQYYEKGQQMVKNEINMFTIVETMMKIKASLIVLIGNDEKKLK
jgi:hypothetical protein